MAGRNGVPSSQVSLYIYLHTYHKNVYYCSLFFSSQRWITLTGWWLMDWLTQDLVLLVFYWLIGNVTFLACGGIYHVVFVSGLSM